MKKEYANILEKIPDTTGVYLHRDAGGTVLYVGKAKSLRNRVRSYFQPSSDHPPHIASMVRLVADVDVFQTDTDRKVTARISLDSHRSRHGAGHGQSYCRCF